MKDELDFESSSDEEEEAKTIPKSNSRKKQEINLSKPTESRRPTKKVTASPNVKETVKAQNSIAAAVTKRKNLDLDELDFDGNDSTDDSTAKEEAVDSAMPADKISNSSQKSSQSSTSSRRRRRRKLSNDPGILGSPMMSPASQQSGSRSRSSTRSTAMDSTSSSQNTRSRRRPRGLEQATTQEDHDLELQESSSDSLDMPPPAAKSNRQDKKTPPNDDYDDDIDDAILASGFKIGQTRSARLKRKAQEQQQQQQQQSTLQKVPKEEEGVWTASHVDSHEESPSSSVPSSSRRGMVKRARRRRPAEYTQRLKKMGGSSVDSTSDTDFSTSKQSNTEEGQNDSSLRGILLGVHEQNQQALEMFASPERKVGTTVDMYDLQNNGQAQLLTDEINYLSDGILQEEGAQISAFAAAMDLAWLLSLEKNRANLFRDTSGDALTTVLDLMAKLPSVRRKTDADHSQVPFSEVWAVMWHFLTLDCTWSSSPIELERARELRLAILSHERALEGMVHLIVQEEEGMIDEMEKSKASSPQKKCSPSGKSASSSTTTSSRRSPKGASRSKHKRKGDMQISQSSLPVISEERDDQDTIDSQPSIDPTVAGRKKRKLKSATSSVTSADLDLSETEDDEESKRTELSFASTISSKHTGSQEEVAIQIEQWSTIKKRVLSSIGKTSLKSSNAQTEISSSRSFGGVTTGLPPNLLLLALQRITTGRMEGAEKSCLDEESQNNNKGGSNMHADDDSEAEIENNPIVVTNKLLSQHDSVIPYMAKSLGSAVSRATVMLETEGDASCVAREDETKQRISILVSIVTDACLFHEGNRDAFCSDDVDSCANGETLVGNLVRYLEAMLAGYKFDLSGIKEIFCGTTPWMSCVALDALKTLTSLTHENPAAVSEMTRLDAWQVFGELIFCHSTTISLPERHDDLAVFTLDTLANLIESSIAKSSHVHAEIARLRVTDRTGRRAKRVLFLPWLVKHLVSLTDSFRFELLGNEMNHGETTSSILVEDRERSNLLLAGNGFVLLAYLLVGSHNTDVESMIINELPGSAFGHKIHFLSKALMAFCNFYRHVVGDLSVAIVAPVQSLLQGLKQKFSKAF